MQQFKRLVWDPKYTVHVDELDIQHQKLFNITNNILSLYEQGTGELYSLIQDLVEYCCTHFRSENEVMIEYNYPDYSEQDSQHSEFLDNMMNFLKSYKEHDKDLTYRMISYLHQWIFSHTVKMDLKYGDYLIRRKHSDKK